MPEYSGMLCSCYRLWKWNICFFIFYRRLFCPSLNVLLKTLLMMYQHWIWIIWSDTHPDLWCNMASLITMILNDAELQSTINYSSALYGHRQWQYVSKLERLFYICDSTTGSNPCSYLTDSGDTRHISGHHGELRGNLIEKHIDVLGGLKGGYEGGLWRKQHNIRLTHWGRDKMDVIFQTHFEMDFREWKCMNCN